MIATIAHDPVTRSGGGPVTFVPDTPRAMDTITVATNLHCASCVDKLKKQLDNAAGVHHWNVDLKDPRKVLTVHGSLSAQGVTALVEQAGFKTVPDAANDHCAVPQSGPSAPAAAGFWGDGRVWRRASLNTLSCLIGCSIGDFGMIIYLQAFHPGTSMAVQMALAIVAGLMTSVMLETVLMRYREKFAWGAALRMAISMSFMSMVAMEVAMNTTDFMITGGRLALTDPAYWLAFIPAAAAGFLVPLPYNYYQLKKHGKACH